jgi:rod shape-determining protein MreC
MAQTTTRTISDDNALIPARWRPRLRLTALAFFILLGLALAALEKSRQDTAYRLWGRAHRWVAPLVEPVQAKTRRFAMVRMRQDELWNVEHEADQLRLEVSRLQLQNDLLRERISRLERLSGLGGWSAPPQLRFLPADVIGSHARDDAVTLLINRGRAEGVAPGQPVVATGGLVGVVRTAFARSAQVQTLTDAMSVVGVATRQGRVRGAVYGQGHGRPLHFLPEDETYRFAIGAELITSGFENSIYPKGILVGVVEGRGIDPYGIPYGSVRPAAPLERIEEALVIIPAEAKTRLGTIAITTPATAPAIVETPTTAPLAAESDTATTATIAAAADAVTSPPAAPASDMMTSPPTATVEDTP